MAVSGQVLFKHMTLLPSDTQSDTYFGSSVLSLSVTHSDSPSIKQHSSQESLLQNLQNLSWFAWEKNNEGGKYHSLMGNPTVDLPCPLGSHTYADASVQPHLMIYLQDTCFAFRRHLFCWWLSEPDRSSQWAWCWLMPLDISLSL